MKAFNYPGKCTLRLHFIPSSLSIFLANKTSILQEFYYRNNFPNFSLLPLYIQFTIVRPLTSSPMTRVSLYSHTSTLLSLSSLSLLKLAIYSRYPYISAKNKDNDTKLSGYDPWGLSRSSMSSRMTLSSKSPVRNPQRPPSTPRS